MDKSTRTDKKKDQAVKNCISKGRRYQICRKLNFSFIEIVSCCCYFFKVRQTLFALFVSGEMKQIHIVQNLSHKIIWRSFWCVLCWYQFEHKTQKPFHSKSKWLGYFFTPQLWQNEFKTTLTNIVSLYARCCIQKVQVNLYLYRTKSTLIMNAVCSHFWFSDSLTVWPKNRYYLKRTTFWNVYNFVKSTYFRHAIVSIQR